MSENNVIHLDLAILGGGFAGVYCAKTLGRQFGRSSPPRIGLISAENYMVFQPMLPEVAGASISPRHVVNPLRLLCRNTRVFRGHIEAIDWPGRCLILNAGPFTGNFTVRYDQLILALGAVVDLKRIPGMPEHSFLMRNVGDAMFLRATILARIEEANVEPEPELKRRLLTFVVVGGGYSGVETAGHILDLFRSIHVYYPSIGAHDLQVYLVHGGDHLLPTLSRKLGEYSARKLQERGLKLVLNQRVKAVTAHRVYLEDGSPIETNTVISTVGNAPHPLIVRLCEQNGFAAEHGRILTEPTGQVKGQSKLWAAGDCAAFPLATGGYCPGTAQFALRQGVHLANNVTRLLRDQPPQPFTFRGQGEMASIGHHVAVANIFGINFSGFLAWWLWRSVYLAKLPRFDRKVRVMLDWTLDLFFPRDINHLSPRFTKQIKEIFLEQDDVLFHTGEPAFSFYIVKQGCVELREDGEIMQRVTAGGHFGERALMEDGIWHYDARAVEPSKLVSIPGGVFRQIASGAGSLGQFFQKSANKFQSREMVAAVGRKLPAEWAAQPVSALMERHLHTFTPATTVREALAVAQGHPRSSYPVVDGDGRVVGSVVREDFYEFLKRPETGLDTPLNQMRLAAQPTIGANVSVGDTMKQFIRSGSNKLLVVDADQHLQGIVTVMDLVTAQAKTGSTPEQSPSQAGAS